MRLIKTALELEHIKALDQDIFLGSWCVTDPSALMGYKNKNKVLPYHWDDREKFNEDYEYLTSLYEENLTKLTTILNCLHGIDRSKEYWRIIIGPWLRFFSDTLFDRYECIKIAAKSVDIVTYNIGVYELREWCANDFSEFYSDLVSDEWNEVIFSECMIFQKLLTKQQEVLKIKPSRNTNVSFSFRNYAKKLVKKLNRKYSEIITNHKNRIIFVGTYMSITNLLKLNCKLGQVPYSINGIISAPKAALDHELRSKMTLPNCKTDFENFLSQMIPKLMPAIYLESFHDVKKAVSNSLAETPKSIFTSVSYQSDDVFKIWAAEQKMLGSRLIIGQHGGHFGIGKHNQTVDHQILTATDFVSWGWKNNEQSNVTQLSSIILADAVTVKPVKDGNILHIMTNLPRYFYCHYSFPVAGQFLSYLDQQIKFFGELEVSRLECLKIRLDTSFVDQGWDVKNLIKVAGYYEHVDQSHKELWSLLKKSRLCICTHNATVFLETLSKNFPTIIFWDKEMNEINPEAQPTLDLLIDANILFDSPSSAASMVNSIADNVEDWWFSDKVQSARTIFCERYAVTSANWKEEWVNFFTKN